MFEVFCLGVKNAAVYSYPIPKLRISIHPSAQAVPSFVKPAATGGEY